MSVRYWAAALLLPASVLSAGVMTREERKTGFEVLFDGKTLRNWRTVKQKPDAGRWRVRKKVLSWESGGSWLATENTFYDCVLRLEYRTNGDSNSGIFLRATRDGNPAFTGMELQILDDAGKPPGVHSTGSVYGAIAPTRNMALPPGKWNKVEVVLIKNKITVNWNSVTVVDADLSDPAYKNAQEKPLGERAAYGHVGLQAYSKGKPVEFRKIRMRVVKPGPAMLRSPNAD